MNITIHDVFELDKVLNSLLEQQTSYSIQTSFKLYKLVKWVGETEKFIFDRMSLLFGEDSLDTNNPTYIAFLSTQIPFVETDLTIQELIDTEGKVNLDVRDVEILDKMLNKTES